MILQTNDADHHEHVRKRFIDLQTQRMITKARMQGGGMVDLDLRENIDIMIKVMNDLDLHLIATDGYLRIGTTIALNGDQDSEIKREAAACWKEMDMRKLVNKEVADTLRKCKNGEIPWNYAAIRKEITPYPPRNCLDVFSLDRRPRLPSTLTDASGTRTSLNTCRTLKAMWTARSKIFAQKIGWMEPTLMWHTRRSTIRMQNTVVLVPRLWQR